MAGELLRGALANALFTLVALAVLAPVVALLRRAAPGLRHALWGLVLLRLFLPPELALPWSAAGLVAGRLPGVAEAARGGWWGAAGDASEVDAAPAGRRPAASPMASPEALVVVALWLCGGGWTAAALARRRRRYRRLATLPGGAPAAVRALAERFRRRLGIAREVHLVVGEASSSPFTLGLRRPVVYLPRPLVEGGDRDALAAVVAHELAHVARRDDLALAVEAAVAALWFFHPAAWIAVGARRRERERLADRLVLARGLLTPAAYGRGVVAALTLGLEPAAGATGFAAAAKRRAVMRIEEILRSGAPRPTRPALGLAAAVAVGAFLLPMAVPGGAATAGKRPAELANPLPGARVTSPFGDRLDPIAGARRHHDGIDLSAAEGTPILAPAAGVVRLATERYAPAESQGTVVIVDHGGGLATYYSHLGSLAVHAGQAVERGDTLGTTGATGAVTGPHLHFEVRDGGEVVDPALWVGEWAR